MFAKRFAMIAAVSDNGIREFGDRSQLIGETLIRPLQQKVIVTAVKRPIDGIVRAHRFALIAVHARR